MGLVADVYHSGTCNKPKGLKVAKTDKMVKLMGTMVDKHNGQWAMSMMVNKKWRVFCDGHLQF